MNRKQKRRVFLISALIILVGALVSLVLVVLNKNIDLYFTPSELAASPVTQSRTVRVGGWVKPGSLEYAMGQRVMFVLTDKKASLQVRFKGLLPSLFREGQGIVVGGHRTSSGQFQATEVLAKHDENYHPPKLGELKEKL